MEDSIFTKIIKGEIPCHKVYEDEVTLAFLDIHPITPGHTLVVPKKQIEFLWDLDDASYQAVMKTSQKVARRLRDVLEIPYVGVQVVGVDVPHTHIHLVPFKKAAEYHGRSDATSEPDHSALAAMAERVAF